MYRLWFILILSVKALEITRKKRYRTEQLTQVFVQLVNPM